MDFTQTQKYEILRDQLKKDNGFEELIKASMEIMMRAEQEEYIKQTELYRNGYRPRKVYGCGKVFELRVPRVRGGAFYPLILGILKQQEEEAREIAFELYGAGLTTRQVGTLFERIYGREYSTSQVSRMFDYARGEIKAWLHRPIDKYYAVLYIDAVFINIRRGESCEKEAFYSIVGVKADTTREVLAVVNNPTESAGYWHEIFGQIKERGVQEVGLVVSDGLKGIEDVVKEEFQGAAVQLCTVHLQRDCMREVRPGDRQRMSVELKEVLKAGVPGRTQVQAYREWQELCERWGKRYPAFKRRQNSERYRLYFTFLNYHYAIQDMVYTTNWVERLNRAHRRVTRMRGALPDVDSALLLLGNAAINMTAYKRRIARFLEDEENFRWEA